MIYDNFGGIRDPFKQNLGLQLCRNQNKDVSISTQTHINLDQIHNIRNNLFGAIFLSPGESHVKWLLIVLHLGPETITVVGINQKARFVFFKVTASNDRVLCIYAPSGYSTRGQLPRESFFKELQSSIENKNEVNKNKIIPGDFNWTMDKMERNGRSKTLYRCCFNYPLSKIIVANGQEDLWRKEIPDSSEFTRYDRSSGARFGIDRVYTDKKIARNTKINHIIFYRSLQCYFYWQIPLKN